ncbi:MAG: DUF4062 domain-containing protein [Spirochaetota bacterium]|nr:DUF4062 domain-containing protein [Spirochaetota bacterium]
MPGRIRHNVFIASTLSYLREAWMVVEGAVIAAGQFPILMERFAPSRHRTHDLVKQAIADADVFLLLLGSRGGTYTEVGQKTYSEHEYDCAVNFFNPILVFLPTEEKFQRDVSLSAITPDERYEIWTFRERILTNIS